MIKIVFVSWIVNICLGMTIIYMGIVNSIESNIMGRIFFSLMGMFLVTIGIIVLLEDGGYGNEIINGKNK